MEKTFSSKNSLSYKGEIKVSVMKGHKICSTKVFHNEGRWPLFYFFDLCLSGNYADADKYRPKYIKLFSLGSDGSQAIPTINDSGEPINSISNYTTKSNRVSLKTFLVNSDPEIEVEGEDESQQGIGSSKITLKFLIPFAYISSSAKTRNINLLALYASNTFQDSVIGNPSAFFFVPNDENPDLIGSLVDTELYEAKSTEYNLYIEWALNIKNN